MCIRSQTTRYGLIGVSSDVSMGSHCWQPGLFDGADLVVQRLVGGAPCAACLLAELIQELG